MPTNLPAEWNKYYEEYQKAKSAKEKIKKLKEVLSHTPKNKATDKIRAKYKRKLSELREEMEKEKLKASGGKSISVKKEGDAQVSIIGLVNSGKSTFLKKMTNSEPKIADYPYTTTEPEVGMLEFEGVKIQLVEIPSTLTPEVLSVAKTSDMIVFFIGKFFDKEEQIKKLEKIEKENNFKKYTFIDFSISKKDFFKKLWNVLGLIRVYTKEPGKTATKPMVIEKKSNVEDVSKRLHKDFLRYFKFAKITGPSASFRGQKVGLEHELKDKDIIEIHLRK